MKYKYSKYNYGLLIDFTDAEREADKELFDAIVAFLEYMRVNNIKFNKIGGETLNSDGEIHIRELFLYEPTDRFELVLRRRMGEAEFNKLYNKKKKNMKRKKK